MRPRFIILLAGFLLLQTAAFADTVTVTVLGTAGPWNIDLTTGLNTGFDYGIYDNTAPTIIDTSSGFSLEPGATIMVAYIDGLIRNCDSDSCPYVNADGWEGGGVTNDYSGINSYFPAYYMDSSIAVYTSELVGAFANNGAVVGTPFAVGVGPTSLIVPAGANQLLLGINDNKFSDNLGAFRVSVSTVPEPTSLLFLGTGLGVIGLTAWRKRK